MKLSYLLCIAAVAILAVSCYLGPPNEDYHGYEDVSSYNELQSAVSKGKNVRLSNDISAVDLGYEGALFINSNITIDLNGKKLSFVDTGWDSYRDDLPDAGNPDFYPSGSVVISLGAVLSIIGNNGCIESDFFTGLISNYGTLRVDSAAMESTGRHIFSNHGSIIINSGTFICDDTVFDMCFDSSSLVINDGIFGNNPKTTVLSTGLNTRNAEITVNGGAFLGLFNLSGFTDMVINGGEFEAENSSFFVNSGNLRVNGGTFRSLRNIDWSSYDYVPVNTAYRLGLGLEGDIIIEAEDYHSGNPDVMSLRTQFFQKVCIIIIRAR